MSKSDTLHLMRPIKTWCKSHGETMYSLAARVGVDKGHLSRIDKGNGACSLKIAAAIEKATRFGVTMTDIAKLQEKAKL